MSPFKKTVKKTVKKAGRLIKKNYGGKKGINTLLKDVTMLKNLINVEKKIWVYSGGANAAQQNSLAGATNAVGRSILTFPIPQGVLGGPNPTQAISILNNGCRVGNSVKVTGMVFNIKIAQQASTVNELRYKIYILKKRECVQPMTADQVLAAAFEPNPFTNNLANGAIIDYHSQRFNNTFKQFQLVKTINGKLTADSLASQTAYQHHIVPLKMEMHLKYQGAETTASLSNNLYMFIMCDTGYTATNTGITWEYALKVFYVDN